VARTKEFDPEAALQAALELFWRRGYEATSMSDLVDHLGIGRASLYATFGNKHELYVNYPSLKRRACTTGTTGCGTALAPSPAP